MNKLGAAFRRFMKKSILASRRALKRARLSIRRLAAAIGRLPLKRRLVVLGAGGAGAVALLALVVILCTSGSRAASARAAGTNPSPQQDVLLAGAGAFSAEDVAVVTPPPTPSPTPEPTPIPTPTPTPDPTLRRGMENEEVEKLQRRLIYLGYMDLDEPTQKFGPATEDAVKLFQRQVNFTEELGFSTAETAIAVDGIAGVQTLELIYGASAPKYVVKFGMEGGDVSDVQQQLKDLGYMSAITGYYGEKTVTALKDFQDRNGLSADGLCGEKTISLLYSDDARASASLAKQARTKANISEMISAAKAQLGDKYVLGSTGPDKFDCSGLVYYCLKQAGSNRRRLNAAGYANVSDWEKITNINDLKRGDLIMFYNDGFTKVGHIGIVVSSTEMIDASSKNGKVVRREYKTSYWKEHFYCGRRPW